jgi:hypothetical protein
VVAQVKKTPPTDEELEALIKPLWLAEKPGTEAQDIRARLSNDFNDPAYNQWVSDFIPDYVWDLVDIAAQRGSTRNERTKTSG